jgi:hypothetical protein
MFAVQQCHTRQRNCTLNAWAGPFVTQLHARSCIDMCVPPHRLDPRKNSVATIRLEDICREGACTSRSAAETRHTVPGQRAFYFGPAARVVGGQLRHVAHPEPGHPRPFMPQVASAAEILRASLRRQQALHPGAEADLSGGGVTYRNDKLTLKVRWRCRPVPLS